MVPLPVATTVDSGMRIHPHVAAALRPGECSYREVVADLGPPLLELDGQRAIAYRWDTHTGYRQVLFQEPTPMRVRYQAFCLKFDDQQRLQDHTYFTEKDYDVLTQRMTEWAQIKQAPSFP